MSGADETRLARRAAAAMGDWMPGMYDTKGASVLAVRGDQVCWSEPGHTDHVWARMGDGSSPDMDDWLPDMAHPATLGCLFARLCERLGVSELEALGVVMDIMVRRECGYAEALVIGLEPNP